MQKNQHKTFCIFSALFYPSMGGVEKYTDCLANALASFGHKVIIVTSQIDNSPAEETLFENIEIIRIPSYNLLGSRLPIAKNNAKHRELMRHLDNQSVDYVIVNTRFYRISLIGLAFARQQSITPILVEHGSMHLTLGNPIVDKVVELYEHSITKMGKKYGAHYYGVSKACEQWLNHFGIQSRGSLYNAINCDEFVQLASSRNYRNELDLDTEVFVVSFTGRLTPEKGIQALVDAARLLAGKPIVFLVAGDGPLKTLIADAKLPNLTLLGRLSMPDVAALMLQSDAFCLPTRSEGFSTSLLECAACRTAPIITDVGGVRELVEATDGGIILKDASSETVANAIEKLASDRPLCQAMATRIQDYVRKNFTWENTAKLVEAACREANDHHER